MLFPSGFDRTIALEAGALVKQAYAQFDQFAAKQPWNLEGPYDAPGLLNAKPEELLGHRFVARSQVLGNVFVTFRGTKSLGDWLSDFSFPKSLIHGERWKRDSRVFMNNARPRSKTQ